VNSILESRLQKTPSVGSGNTILQIQGLRGIAVLGVVAYHAGLPLPGGFTGVDMFFVISGFVVSLSIIRHFQKSGHISIRTFYMKRIRRLSPALGFMLSVVLVIMVFLSSPLADFTTAPLTAIGASLGVSNWVIFTTTGGYFDSAAESNEFLNTWTLGVEAQFYLLLPILFAAIFVFKRSLRLYIAGLLFGFIFLVSALAAWLNSLGQVGPRTEFLFGFYGPVGRLWEFLVGVLLVFVVYRKVKFPLVLARAMALLGLGLIGYSFTVINSTAIFPGPMTLVPVVGTGLLLAASLQVQNLRRFLCLDLLLAIGNFSYSWYLWHWPFVVLASGTWGDTWVVKSTAVVASVFPAVISYRFIESRFRYSQSASNSINTNIIGISILAPILIAGIFIFVFKVGMGSPVIRKYQIATSSLHLAQTRGCDGTVALDSESFMDCTWNKDASGSPIYLIGDSNADHFSEAALFAAEELNRPLVISTSHACPFISGKFEWEPMSVDWLAQCDDYREGNLSFLENAPKGTVVVSNIDWYWTSKEILLKSTPSQLAGRESLLETFEMEMIRTVERLQNSGQVVVLVQTAPQWHGQYFWEPRSCLPLSLIRGSCDAEMPRTAALFNQQTVRTAVEAVSTKTGTAIWDSFDELCAGKLCQIESESNVKYYDANHISVEESKVLGPSFKEFLSQN